MNASIVGKYAPVPFEILVRINAAQEIDHKYTPNGGVAKSILETEIDRLVLDFPGYLFDLSENGAMNSFQDPTNTVECNTGIEPDIRIRFATSRRSPEHDIGKHDVHYCTVVLVDVYSRVRVATEEAAFAELASRG